MAYSSRTRRLYGIPDDDHRPFHLAASAAAIARRQRELEERARHTTTVKPNDNAIGRSSAHNVRQIDPLPIAVNPYRSQDIQSSYASLGHHESSSFFPCVFARFSHGWTDSVCRAQQQPQQQSASARYDPAPQLVPPPLPRVVSSRTGVARLALGNVSNLDGPAYGRKHSSEGKRIVPVHVPVEPAQNQPFIKRATKRQVDSDSEDEGQERKKRARWHDGLDADTDDRMNEVTRDDTTTDESDMDTAEELSVPHRSLKRGRSDAGSVLDDSTRERKIRRKGSAPALPVNRRRKRAESDDSDDFDEPAVKKGRTSLEDIDSDEAMTEAEDGDGEEDTQETQTTEATEIEVEVEPSCQGRKIGDRWTEDEAEYQVGPGGKRLRKVYVKEKTTLPIKVQFAVSLSPPVLTRLQVKDFANAIPGNNSTPARIPTPRTVLVQRWFTDEEYDIAKAKDQLAWDDTDDDASVIETSPPVAVADRKDNQLAVATTSSGGKTMLWNSPSRQGSRGSTPSLSVQPSPATSASKLDNPFRANASQAASIRRIASSVGGQQAQPRYSRSFSKWEKMDAEADALEKLRKREQEELAEKMRANSAKTPAADPTPAANLFAPKPTESAKPAAAAPSANPLFSFPKSADVAAASSGKPTSDATAKSSETKSAEVPKDSTPAVPQPAAAEAPKPAFSFPPPVSSTASTAPTNSTPTAPTPLFNIPTNPLSMAPGDKPSSSSTSVPAAFSFAPTKSSSNSSAATGTEKKADGFKSAFSGFTNPSSSSGNLSNLAFKPAEPTASGAPSAASSAPNMFAPSANSAAATPSLFPPKASTPNAATPTVPNAGTQPAKSPFGFPTPGNAGNSNTATGFSFPVANAAPDASKSVPAPSGGISFASSGSAATPAASGGFKFNLSSTQSNAGADATKPQTPSVFGNPAAGAAAATPGASLFTGLGASQNPAAAPAASSFFATPPAGAPAGGPNPFAPPSVPGMSATGRPMRGRSTLASKPPLGSTVSSSAGANTPFSGFGSNPAASSGAAPSGGGLFNFAGTSGAAPAAGAAPFSWNFTPGAAASQGQQQQQQQQQQPSQGNPLFGGGAFGQAK